MRSKDGPPLQPFLRWPGGKRWLGPTIASIVGPSPRRYIEPFLGGGALFFYLRPLEALLSDINGELINTYRQVKRYAPAIIDRLRQFDVSQSTYYNVRAAQPPKALDRAVRFLYLNRTAFAGLYRLNKKGQFNVPYGGGERTAQILCESTILRDAARALQHATLTVCDFEDALARAGVGDTVYCDPTFTVAHDSNGFVRYNERNFSWEDQKRLASACLMASRRGALVVVSNAHNAAVAQLYRKGFQMTVERLSLLSPSTVFRRRVQEYVFVLDPRRRRRAIHVPEIRASGT